MLSRARQGALVVFEKERYRKNLDYLRDCNDDLAKLLNHICQFQNPEEAKQKTMSHTTIPSSGFNKIQKVLQKLHEAIAVAWCCSDEGHDGHRAKLCLDVKEAQHGIICTRLALMTLQERPCQDASRMLQPMVWALVQSNSNIVPAQFEMEKFNRQTVVLDPRKELLSALVSEISHVEDQRAQKRRKLSKCNAVNISGPFLREHDPSAAQQRSEYEGNLVARQITNICHLLKQLGQTNPVIQTTNFTGYLGSRLKYSHILSTRNSWVESRKAAPEFTSSKTISLEALIRIPAEDHITIEEQLKLAHKLALMVLQLHDTPWLGEEWHLRDITLFSDSDRVQVTEEDMQTLHVSADFLRKGPNIQLGSTPAPTLDDTLIQYGVNNIALFYLGVALIEIGFWKPLESLGSGQDLSDAVTARRLSNRPAPLGSRYQNIVQKCLQCNFGQGTDLRKEELQTAVHNDVVCQLEGMIESLSI